MVRKVLQALVNLGPWGFCVAVAQMIARRLHLIESPARVIPSDIPGNTVNVTHPFDVTHGTDTSGIIWGQNLSSGHRNDLWSTAYYGVAPSFFNQILNNLNLDWQRFTFIDLGCGKGRALILASRFPFRRIIGVELAPQLSSVAATNLQRFSAPWQKCHNIEARNGDATSFDYPAGPIVLYVYNPFLAPVLKRCLQNLTLSLVSEPRELHLIYAFPAFERLLKKHAPALEKQWERVFMMADEDALADRFGSNQERVVVYRYLPPE
jgi:SAM-dependent methyltransferase